MFDENFFSSLSHGEDRLDYLKKCIAEADAEKDAEKMLDYRYKYIKESVFHDDTFKAVIIFPEFVKLFDENPGAFDQRLFMFAYKWILENTPEYYQISVEQIEKYFDRFKEYIEKFGYTMRTYYLKKFRAFRDIDLPKALEYCDEVQKYERTSISDCAACEASNFAEREIKYGSQTKAVKMLNEMLDKNMRCAEVPQVTYGDFAEVFARKGMYEEAEHYADLMMPMIRGDEVNFLESVSAVLIIKSFTDLNYAFDLFSRCAGFYSRIKNPFLKFCFAEASYRFLTEVEKREIKSIKLRLSSDFELHDPEGVYDVLMLKDFFYDNACELAEKFDKRNGNDNFKERLAFEFPEAPLTKLELPLHGSITPEPPVVGVLCRELENLPTPNHFAKSLYERLGFADPGLTQTDDGKEFYYTAVTADGEQVRYRMIFDEAPDLSAYRSIHELPEDHLDTLSDYGCMLVIIPDIIHTDRYEEILRLLTFADIMNTDGSPVVLYHSCNKMLSSKWVSNIAEGKTPPRSCDCLRYWLYASAFEEDKVDILTSGLDVFGSHELAATAVDKEQIDFTIGLLEKIAEELTLKPLLDEGITMNSGIVYDDKSYVRFSWTPVRFPDENDEIAEDAAVYAEPLYYLTPSDVTEERPLLARDITEEMTGLLSPRKHFKITERNERISKMLFSKALNYFMNNDCEMIVGLNAKGTDKEGDPCDSYFYGTLSEDGKECTVTSFGDEMRDLSEGMKMPVDPENIFFFRIDIGEDRYFADDLYIITD